MQFLRYDDSETREKACIAKDRSIYMVMKSKNWLEYFSNVYSALYHL